jgi:hypothetical protein
MLYAIILSHFFTYALIAALFLDVLFTFHSVPLTRLGVVQNVMASTR